MTVSPRFPLLSALSARSAPLLVPCLLPLILASPLAASDERLPNFVVFLADDAGWGDFSHSGNSMLSTPRIDSIAREGASFDRFFVCPVCAPTRAEFLTGRYHPRTGVSGVSTGRERLNLDETTLADSLRAAGYATGAFGKWHNGTQYPYHPRGRGFDEYFGHTSGHWGEYFDAPLDDGSGRMVRTEGYIVDVCTDRAIDFIDRHREGPFFCYVPFTTPHSPWAVPEEYWERFREAEVTQRSTLPDQEDLDHTRCALAMMENQDWNVGRVLDKLEELGLAEDTIVFYFSDNGPNSWRWNGGMKGRKGQLDEGGVRSVAYLRWPGAIDAGLEIPQIAGAIDLLPTFLALAGAPHIGTKPLDGIDFSPLLLGGSESADENWPDRYLVSAWNRRASLRTQTHRLDPEGRLFDMVADPGQTEAVNESEPELLSTLTEALATWTSEVHADSPTPAETPDMTPEQRRALRNQVDPRLIPAGHREFPFTDLPARDATPRGTLERSSNAPNCSYFVSWSSTEDTITWEIEVATAGRYAIAVDYTCPVDDAGATVVLSFRDEPVLSATIAEGWDPPLYDNQDTLPRPPGESTMKPFKSLELGEATLPAGAGALSLRASEIPGASVMDLRRLTLTLLEPAE